MLVLTRRADQALVIDGSISIRVLSVHGDVVRLGIEAPRSVSVDRMEVYLRKLGETESKAVSEQCVACE